MGRHGGEVRAFGYLATRPQEQILALAHVDQLLHLALRNAVRSPLVLFWPPLWHQLMVRPTIVVLCAWKTCRDLMAKRNGQVAVGTGSAASA